MWLKALMKIYAWNKHWSALNWINTLLSVALLNNSFFFAGVYINWHRETDIFLLLCIFCESHSRKWFTVTAALQTCLLTSVESLYNTDFPSCHEAKFRKMSLSSKKLVLKKHLDFTLVPKGTDLWLSRWNTTRVGWFCTIRNLFEMLVKATIEESTDFSYYFDLWLLSL